MPRCETAPRSCPGGPTPHSHSSRKIRRSAISRPSGLSWSCRMTSGSDLAGEVRTRRRSRLAAGPSASARRPHPRKTGREHVSDLAPGELSDQPLDRLEVESKGGAVTLCGTQVFESMHDRPTSTPGRARSRTPRWLATVCTASRSGWACNSGPTLGVLLVSTCPDEG